MNKDKRFKDQLEKKSTYIPPQPKLGRYISIFWEDENVWCAGYVVEHKPNEILVAHDDGSFVFYDLPMKFFFKTLKAPDTEAVSLIREGESEAQLITYTISPGSTEVECCVEDLDDLLN
jgi:hypothetical protein